MTDLNTMSIVDFDLVGEHTIKMVFADGKVQEINFLPVVGQGWMKDLADPQYFAQVRLNDGGNLEWPDGQDFNPEALYDWQNFERVYIEEANQNLKSA
ncbi:MAG TPA: DUF2442 domain-containing protein [Cellvibrio sp.]|nr:DUF2442 domain-containing protein [Cellvibrio sp.]